MLGVGVLPAPYEVYRKLLDGTLTIPNRHGLRPLRRGRLSGCLAVLRGLVGLGAPQGAREGGLLSLIHI
eukprot:6548181-Alexandrium_andersonii.AAC.1